MATINVSLPDELKEFVDAQVREKRLEGITPMNHQRYTLKHEDT